MEYRIEVRYTRKQNLRDYDGQGSTTIYGIVRADTERDATKHAKMIAKNRGAGEIHSVIVTNINNQ